MKKAGFLLAGLLTFVSIPSAYALSLRLENKSKWVIHELYFSPADADEWGPDQLEDEVIEHEETFTLKKIAAGKYDVKIVDEDGDACEIEDVDFESSEHFVLTEAVLLGCQQATAKEADDE